MGMAVPTKIAAARASDRLTRAIDDLTRQGLRYHCADEEVSHLWTSEDSQDRALAIKLCRGCPILKVCDEVASIRRESFGVWAGRDRTRVPGKKGRPPKTAVIGPDEAA